MKIGLIGYGKMGRAIERLALDKGHEIAFIHGEKTIPSKQDIIKADVCIEFTTPQSAVGNIKACMDSGIPVVSGTTGWLDEKNEIDDYCIQQNAAFFYASNFSLGVNIFFTLNEQLARLIANFDQYSVNLEEIHHTQKKDAPSGTAITLLEGILQNTNLKEWHVGHEPSKESIPVSVKRIDPTPGTHSVIYSSMIDQIEIKHTAHSRDGFALGSIAAAQWLIGKKGVFGMSDMLNLK